MEKINTELHERFNIFINQCIPLGTENNDIYFFSKSTKQIYGLDNKGSFFEPISSLQIKIINNYYNNIINDQIINDIVTCFNIKFNDLIKLQVNNNNILKHIGKIFFYNPKDKNIYVWNNFESKWSIESNINKLKSLFSNTKIFIQSDEEIS